MPDAAKPRKGSKREATPAPVEEITQKAGTDEDVPTDASDRHRCRYVDRPGLNDIRFDVTIAEKQGTDWSFNRLLFANCAITQAQPGSITVADVPSAVFTCAALTVKMEKGI